MKRKQLWSRLRGFGLRWSDVWRLLRRELIRSGEFSAAFRAAACLLLLFCHSPVATASASGFTGHCKTCYALVLLFIVSCVLPLAVVQPEL